MTRRRKLAIGCALGAALAVGGPLLAIRGLEARWRQGADEEVRRLDAELGPSPSLAVDLVGTASLRRALDRIGVLSDKEDDAVRSERLRFFNALRDPKRGDKLEAHERALEAVLARLTAAEADLDAALGTEGWDLNADGQAERGTELPPVRRVTAMFDLLEARIAWSARRGEGSSAWEDVERCLSIAGHVHASWWARAGMSEMATFHIHALVPRLIRSLEPARRERLRRRLEALERPDLALRAARDMLAGGCSRWSPDERGLALAEERALKARESTDERAAGFLRWPRAVRRLVYLHDRARFVRLGAEVVRAFERPMLHAYGDVRAIETQVEALDPAWAPVSTSEASKFPFVLPTMNVNLVARLSAARFVLALTAGRELPAEPAVRVADPWSADGAPLKWRRIDARRGLVWSVGPDSRDDGGQSELDLCFDVVLPGD